MPTTAPGHTSGLLITLWADPGRVYACFFTSRRGRGAGVWEAKHAALFIWLRRRTVGYRAARSARQANVVNAECSIYETG